MHSWPAGTTLFLTAGAFVLILVLTTGCVQTRTPEKSPPGTTPEVTAPIRSQYSPGEITDLTRAAEQAANASLNGIAALPREQRNPDTTLLAFDKVMTDYDDAVKPLILMGYVYPVPGIAREGMASEESAKIFTTGVYSRRDLYDAIKAQVPRTAEESRLSTMTIREFEHNGLALPDDRLTMVRAMKANLSGLETRFSANLNNDNTTLEFTAEELRGVPDSSLATFTQNLDGNDLVTLKYPDYLAVMKNADRSETRKTIYAAYMNRQADENTALLEEAITLRQQIARELGYPTWAEYQLDGRMAGSTEQVMAFLTSLKQPLLEKNRAETAQLLVIKQSLDPTATAVDPWDIQYLLEKQKNIHYAYDEDEVKAYFAFDNVLNGMFGIYGTLFHVRFDEVKGAPVWSPEVRLFRVSNLTDNSTTGYLYLDPYPRAGKYGHFCESTIISGRMKDGAYTVPVAAIIGNFHPPEGDKPALLTPDELTTLFHETGHAMHTLLTRAPYGTLSGTNVAWDFVETPSQTLEEWPWNPDVMESLSGHYTNTSRKIPPELRDRVIAARDVGTGYSYTRQLANSLEDMEFHTADGPVNVTQVSDRIYGEVTGIPPLAGTHQPASFEHIMGGL